MSERRRQQRAQNGGATRGDGQRPTRHKKRRQRAADDFLRARARRLAHFASGIGDNFVTHSRRTSGFASAASEAIVEARQGGGGLAFEQRLDQINAPARAVALVGIQAVSRAGGQAHSAMDALADLGRRRRRFARAQRRRRRRRQNRFHRTDYNAGNGQDFAVAGRRRSGFVDFSRIARRRRRQRRKAGGERETRALSSLRRLSPARRAVRVRKPAIVKIADRARWLITAAMSSFA